MRALAGSAGVVAVAGAAADVIVAAWLKRLVEGKPLLRLSVAAGWRRSDNLRKCANRTEIHLFQERWKCRRDGPLIKYALSADYDTSDNRSFCRVCSR